MRFGQAVPDAVARDITELVERQPAADGFAIPPALRAALPTLGLPEHCVAERALRAGLGTRAPSADRDWRTWNAGRERAWRIARDYAASPAATAGATPRASRSSITPNSPMLTNSSAPSPKA